MEQNRIGTVIISMITHISTMPYCCCKLCLQIKPIIAIKDLCKMEANGIRLIRILGVYEKYG